MLYLSNSDYHIDENGQLNEPYLVTWDTSFHFMRKTMLNDTTSDATFWYIYTPMKLVDRLSVMNFNLNPQSINFNIIALTEANFNYTSKYATFLDVISSFFNTDDLSQLGIIRKLSTLNKTRESEIQAQQIDFGEEESPFLQLLLEIKNHFSSNEKIDFKEIITLFESPNLEHKIISTLQIGMGGNKELMYEQFVRMVEEDKLLRN